MSKEHCLKHESYLKYNNDRSNRIALSQQLHGYYDAKSAALPLFNLKFIDASETAEYDGRYRVNLEIQAYNHESTSFVFHRLKEGSTATDDPLVMKTFVHVLNPNVFKLCMEWKYKNINKIWKEYDSMDSAVP
ncbi:hypothetical protein HDU91_002051 [Kappamyces sp. JEL0680]|nr:hypothetical protein HDU91_002051 [Kappamyces sp. JEL0680]